MIRRRLPSSLSLAILLAATPGSISLQQAAGQTPSPPGFAALFNGQDLEGWHGRGHVNPQEYDNLGPEAQRERRSRESAEARQHWRVENGELLNDGQGPYLTTDQEYGDIELLLEYRTVPRADSGIYLRGSPQVQIWDTTEEGGKWNLGADRGSGGLWNNPPGSPGKDPLVHADRPFGEWNHLRILQIGARTSVWLNQELVVDHAIMENFWDKSRPLWARGPIQLQTHGGEIRWRGLFLREIPAAEATRLLRRPDEGFRPLFNGQDFEGWEGAVGSYEIRDGAVVCRPGQGGTLYTREEFADFVVRLEFRLPPGGNNGLAIRYPGHGDAAYEGLCEVQVLDSEDPRYARLDPRQHHGSAYGLAAAHRGYLRPCGVWNYQEVTVQGSTLKVELNGTPILETDLAKVAGSLEDRLHPGQGRRSGRFGFCGHNDAVAFRNIAVKRLD